MRPIECIIIKDHYHNAYKDSLNQGKGKDSTYTKRKHDLWSSKLVAKNLITRTVLLQWQIFRFPNPCFLIVTNKFMKLWSQVKQDNISVTMWEHLRIKIA